MVFVLTNAMLVIVDVGSGANAGFLGMDYAYWVILFWGFGLAGHAVSVFAGDRRVAKVYARERERENH